MILFAFASMQAPAPDLTSAIASQSNAFGLKVAYQIVGDSRKNFVLSPLSLYIALGALYAGAAGSTSKVLRNVLGLTSEEPSANHEEFRGLSQLTSYQATAIQIANSVWSAPRFRLSPSYRELAARYFQMEADNLRDLDAHGVGQINGWVDSKTKGMIPTVIQKLGPDTELVLVNAIYFDGKWKSPFKKEQTRPLPFGDGVNSVSVPMMQQTSFVDLSNRGTVRVLRIPYKEGFSMWVALPATGEDPAGALSALNENLAFTTQRVDLQLPKFKFEGSYDLCESLSALGLEGLFRSADFSGFSPDLPPGRGKISQVIQKTKIDVDELGTKAAAATAIVMSRSAVMRQTPPVQFHVDHPFAFVIKNDLNGAILFQGVIYQPEPEA